MSNGRPPAEIALIPAMARTRGIASNTFRYKCPRGRIHTAFVNINALWRARPRHRSVPDARTCAKREIEIERSLRAGGEHRPDLSGRGRVSRRSPRSYAKIFQHRGSLCRVDPHVRFREAVPWSLLVLRTRDLA